MSKFTFMCENDGVMNAMEFEAEYWDDVVNNFKQFLRGSGFIFDDEVLEEVFETGDKQFDLDHLPTSNWPFAPTEDEKCPCEHKTCGVCGCC